MNSAEFTHIPVLLHECLSILQPSEGETILDVTLGLGGHAEAFLRAMHGKGQFIGVDADAKNLERAQERLQGKGESLRFLQGNFMNIRTTDIPQVDVLLADLGVSSPHFDDPTRGFSFRSEGPLDLRFDQSRGKSAAEWIASHDREDIARALRTYGELREAGRFATLLKKTPPTTTTALKTLVEEAVGYRAPTLLPQVFQALRIAINKEMDALESLLSAIPSLLKPGGRVGIISYHSLEDRLVKHVFKALTTPEKDSYTGAIAVESPFIALEKGGITASEEERTRNPRSRSARLRATRKRGISS